ncbi:hypothetical protein B0H16DRAFT_417208 [Mycena metata]|uniref:C2H2-type domain-containing protein n=1 Tax=Mycena metata TaxID=1033252 RepID=A0AAD7JIS4_9AGAR|nr:hypothetical protein B0H16DRAFT_417208 [Mycena metata]
MLPSCADRSFPMHPGSALPTHRLTTKFNFPPQFPAISIKRYPSLTCALANNYPGLVYDHADGDKSPTSVFSAQESFPLSPSESFSVSASSNPGSGGYCSADRHNSNTLNNVPVLSQDCAAEYISARRPSLTKRPIDEKQVSEDKCHICGRLFRRPGSLFSHVRRHDEPPGPFFKCGTCQQSFLRASALEKHLKRHVAGFRAKPRPKHKCPICHKEFLRPSAVETHMNIHYDRHPFQCPLAECQKTFSARSNAVRHMQVHGVSEPPLVIPPSAKRYEVKFCPPQILVDLVVPLTEPATAELKWIAGGSL